MKSGIKIWASLLLVLALLCSPVTVGAAEQAFGEESLDIEKVYAAPEDKQSYCTSIEEAGRELVKQIEDREAQPSVRIETRSLDGIHTKVFQAATAHTGNPKQGDYMYWQCGGFRGGSTGYEYRGTYYLTLTYSIPYYTTARQEEELDKAVNKLMDALDIEDATDYEKIRAIYDYICQNVTYDFDALYQRDNMLPYTAYAALIQGKAVCQGYSNLFYRLALEAGVDARIISGIGNGGPHGWNIVKLGGKYYNLDATWDSAWAQVGGEYEYFLLSDEDFEDHYRDEKYETEEFLRSYPVSAQSYQPGRILRGDFSGDAELTDADAIYLLWHTLFPGNYPVSQSADVNGDGQTDDQDAIYLLWHTLFPDLYPLHE